MKTHTPGPYHIDEMTHIDADNLPRNWIAVVDHDGKEDGGLGSVVCYCHEQNAQLFSSAPALLAALEEIETVCTESAADCRKRMGTRVGNALAIARSALSLARGSNPSPTPDPRDAEIKRLREALKLALEWSEDGSPDSERGALELEFRDAARAALAEGGAR